MQPVYFSLESWRISNIKKQKPVVKNCSICLNPTKKMSKWDRLHKGLSTVEKYPENITLICNHTFHTSCINKWLENNNTCPNCRTIV